MSLYKKHSEHKGQCIKLYHKQLLFIRQLLIRMNKARISIIINLKVAYQSSAPVFLQKLLTRNIYEKKSPMQFYFSFLLSNSKVTFHSTFSLCCFIFFPFGDRGEIVGKYIFHVYKLFSFQTHRCLLLP